MGFYKWFRKALAVFGVPHTAGGKLLVNGVPVGAPQTLLGSAVVIGVPSSGVIGNNGALTLTTALNIIYSDGLYLYFPAGAVFAGSTAGAYWAVMSSTTVGTIFDHIHTGDGEPVYRASPTPFVTTGPGAYAQTTAEVTLLSASIPGGALGVNGTVQCDTLFEYPNSAGAKTRRIRIGGTAVNNNGPTTTVASRGLVCTFNAGRVDRQVTSPNNLSVNASSATATTVVTAIDTSVAQPLAVTLQIAVVLDWVLLRLSDIRIIRR